MGVGDLVARTHALDMPVVDIARRLDRSAAASRRRIAEDGIDETTLRQLVLDGALAMAKT